MGTHVSPQLSTSSKVFFHHLRYTEVPDGKGNFAVVRWDTDESTSLNQQALQILNLLSQGKTAHEVAQILKTTDADVLHLIRFFISVGYVAQIDTQILPDTFEKIKPWLPHVSRKWFSWILSKPVLMLSFIYMFIGLLLGFSVEKYFPSYRDYFWTQDLLTVAVVGAVLSWTLLFLHEFVHFITAKAVGAESNMRLSSRFLSLVAVTEHYHLAVLPKVFRYLVYLSGMYFDMLIIASILWIFTLSDALQFNLGIYRNLLSAIFLLEMAGIIWEFNAYLETDMYNFLADFFNQDNLYNDAKKFMFHKVNKWKNPLLKPLKFILIKIIFTKKRLSLANDLRSFHAAEHKQFMIYSILYVIGLLFSCMLFFGYYLPRDMLFIDKSVQIFMTAFDTSSSLILFKAVIIVILTFIPYVLLIDAIVKKVRIHGSFI